MIRYVRMADPELLPRGRCSELDRVSERELPHVSGRILEIAPSRVVGQRHAGDAI
jgi:hypothetical protein